MTKKILAAVVAVMMVMALSVSAFADISLLDSVPGTINEQQNIPIPEGVDVSDGATVTVIAKGTSDNTMVRFYLTDAADGGRVTEVAEVPVENGAFDVTINLVIDASGAIQGSAAPTHLMFKGPDYATPPANVVFETLTIVTAGGEAAPADDAADAPADTTHEPDTTPEPDTTTTEPDTTTPEPTAPAPSTSTAPATGLALAVVPAVMALAAVAVSKKR